MFLYAYIICLYYYQSSTSKQGFLFIKIPNPNQKLAGDVYGSNETCIATCGGFVYVSHLSVFKGCGTLEHNIAVRVSMPRRLCDNEECIYYSAMPQPQQEPIKARGRKCVCPQLLPVKIQHPTLNRETYNAVMLWVFSVFLTKKADLLVYCRKWPEGRFTLLASPSEMLSLNCYWLFAPTDRLYLQPRRPKRCLLSCQKEIIQYSFVMKTERVPDSFPNWPDLRKRSLSS